MPFFFRSAAILKVLVRPNWFSNLFVIVVTAQVGTFVPGKRSKVKWSYKENQTFVQKLLSGRFDAIFSHDLQQKILGK